MCNSTYMCIYMYMYVSLTSIEHKINITILRGIAETDPDEFANTLVAGLPDLTESSQLGTGDSLTLHSTQHGERWQKQFQQQNTG